MILYDYWRSSSAWRVRIALHWKGIPFERRTVNLRAHGQDGPDFRALNPMGQVPVLVVDDGGVSRIISQSQAIIAYLEERFPTPPLLPAHPWRRARARQLAEMITSGVQPMQNLAFLEHLGQQGLPAPKEIARHYNARGLAALEAAAIETTGRFLIGDAPTVADVCLIPQLSSARRFDVDVTPYRTLLRVEEACATLPAFAASDPRVQTDAEPA